MHEVLAVICNDDLPLICKSSDGLIDSSAVHTHAAVYVFCILSADASH